MTGPHVGYSGKQMAHAVSLDTNHANAFASVMGLWQSSRVSARTGQPGPLPWIPGQMCQFRK